MGRCGFKEGFKKRNETRRPYSETSGGLRVICSKVWEAMIEETWGKMMRRGRRAEA